VTGTEKSLTVKVTRPAKVRLSYRVLRPEWPEGDKPILQRQRPGDSAEVVRSDVVVENDFIEWQATPGEYELRPGRK
jgi:hypothetical protein